MDNDSSKLSKNQEEMQALKTQKKVLRSLMKPRLSSISKEAIHAQSTTIFERLKKFQPYVDAKRIGIYLSMPSGEVQTDAIVRHALGSGKQVFVPYLHKAVIEPFPSAQIEEGVVDTRPRAVMDMVDLRTLEDYDSLTPDAWGIPTIGEETIDEREHILKGATAKSRGLDLILMPGVAFEQDPKTGLVKRLGHGKGFYDLFLERYQFRGISGSQLKEATEGRGMDSLLYGLALKEQFLSTEAIDPDSVLESVPVGPLDKPLHGLLIGDGDIKEGPVHTK